MKKSIVMVVLFLGLIFEMNVFAGQKPKKDPCDDEKAVASMSQQEMNDCAAKDLKKADAELNQVYQQLISKIDDEEQKAKVKASELAWIKYRDAQCECEAFPNQGGTIYPLIYNGCLAHVTRARVKELKDMMEVFGLK